MASSEGSTRLANVTSMECKQRGANASAVSAVGFSCDKCAVDAALRDGEAVIDLGSGAGHDVFLAADLVGPTGRVVGLDTSEDMVALSRRNAKAKGVKPPHVAFTLASFTEELPIESCSVDCVLSNCTINFLPKDAKALTLRETYRVLRPGGRIHFSDIFAICDIPAERRKDSKIYAECISSEEYKDLLRGFGFIDVSSSPATLKCRETGALASLDAKQLIASQISARKPDGFEEEISTTILKRWWDAYPPVRSSPEAIANEEVAALIRDRSKKEDFIVVDVRRNDHAGGHVRGSVQCPAQSFYDDAPGYFEKFKNTEKVIFYCQSSNGRGPRCAGWYQDYLDSVDCSSSKAYVLNGGIKGWMGKYKKEQDLVDYD